MNFLETLILFIASFIAALFLDTFWHFLFWGEQYQNGLQKIASLAGGEIQYHATSGVLAQSITVLLLMFLVLFRQNGTAIRFADGILIGAAAGSLAISVRAFANYWVIKNWGLGITLLEALWGPIFGGLIGLFVVWARPRVRLSRENAG